MFSNNLSDYEIISKFDKYNGRLGTVYMGNYRRKNKCVAIKRISLEQQGDEEMKAVCEDVWFSRQFKHANINTILHSFIWKSDVYLLYPFMCLGSCQNLLEQLFITGFPETFIALIFRDVLAALLYMHMKGFVHGSVKSSHILLDRHKAMLSSFRSCRCFIDHGEKHSVLYGMSKLDKDNLNWTAPEVLDQNLCGYTEKSDIYSIGITSCELANGVQPYVDTQPTFMYTEKVRGNVPSLLDQSTCSTLLDEPGTLQPHYAATAHEIYSQRLLSDDFHQYTEICLNRNPLNRWSAQQLLTHSFFKQCRHTSISDQLKAFDTSNSRCQDITGNIQTLHDDNDRSHADVQWDFQ